MTKAQGSKHSTTLSFLLLTVGLILIAFDAVGLGWLLLACGAGVAYLAADR